ncbi:MAG: hypothetical protein ACUZ8H_02805 [Candidatus Anammoxibacter sp.]
MEKIKDIFLLYFDKIAIGFAVLVFLYSIFNFLTNIVKDDAVKRIEEFSPVVERNIRQGKPEEITELDYAIKLARMFDNIPLPVDINVNTSKPGTPAERTWPYDYGLPVQQSQNEFEPGDTEIIYKGGTSQKAIIIIKKSTEEYELEQSFIILPGEKIGEYKPLNDKKRIEDFMTGCTLLQIITDAKKSINSSNILVNLDDKGEFINTTLKSDPYEITTMKIIYKNERLGGAIKELLVGASANIGTVTPLLEHEQPASEDTGGWQIKETIQRTIKSVKDKITK